MKILLLEDDEHLGGLILEHLSNSHKISWGKTFEEALALTQKTKFDLMLLDVNLPDGDGFSFLKELRGYHDKTPAIFITSASGAKDVKRGFEIGCDDYLKKPFDFEELEARIWHVKKIYSIDENRPIELGGGVFFDPSGLCVTVDGQSVKLRPMEAKLLSYFVANQDRFISYEEIFRSLWSFDDTPDEATVRYYVKNIRKALGRDFIQSQRGVGYRFERI